MRYLAAVVALIVAIGTNATSRAGGLVIRDRPQPGDFALVQDRRAAVIVHDDQDYAVVGIAARCLADDVERVTGVRPLVQRDDASAGAAQRTVLIGSIDRSGPIRALIDAGKLDVADLRGQWESFKYANVEGTLVIAGSDRRGAAYGALELSRAIGVSPWSWWADVPPPRRQQLHVAITDAARIGPPAVKYRGIFLNDEDFALQPWAARTFEPEVGDIGPKTYARIFELLLRLRANYCWPAMHDCTKAFNHYPQNKQVADDYAIVMGSSHCEQMLRNNVSEWPRDRHDDWNPVTNLPEIVEYWEARVRENAAFESTWTLGMRGIHDGSMPGGGSIDEKRARMEKIIGLQRDMLARHVRPDVATVPQIFCPYKEVLNVYRSGLNLPDDVTIVWPDDNFGYIRQLPDTRERARGGGHGIYYHLSYWGRPHDYLWLESTSPALIWSEMTRAYDFGAQRLWVVNVGDIKPIEAGTTLFLELAWNPKRYGADVQRAFLRDFYTGQFGSELGSAIADLKDEYFRLCAIRRPEHMGFNRVDPMSPVRDSDWTDEQASRVLQRWQSVAAGAEAIAGRLPESSRDAYFQLVEYPARAAAAMAEKSILAERARRLSVSSDPSASDEPAERARAAQRRIRELTDRYNALAGGKWRGMMNDRPRRLAVFDMPPTTRPAKSAAPASPATQPLPVPDGDAQDIQTAGTEPSVIEIDATKFARQNDRNGVGWRIVEGLGPRGGAIALFPRADSPTLRSADQIRATAPSAEYTFDIATAAESEITIEALPTYRRTSEHELLTAVSIDDGEPSIVRFEKGKDDERDPTWQANVLRSAMFGKATLAVAPGQHTLRLWAADDGVVVSRITIVAKKGRS